jgi:putative membrane protein
MEWLDELYPWIRAFHIMAVISWMAGLFYLPRLFVYHATVPLGDPRDETFRIMERRLYRYIMQPAMVAAWLAGLVLIAIIGFDHIWLHVKLLAVVLMTVFHFRLAFHVNRFATGKNRHTERYFRVINEIPTLLMIVIVIMAVVKPF